MNPASPHFLFSFLIVLSQHFTTGTQSTIVHLLGIDHEQLTYRFQEWRFRLTDVHGHLAKGILA